MRSSIQFLTLFLPLFASSSCIYSPGHVHELVARGDEEGVSSWSYTGETGPLGWHLLSANNTLCKHGKYQSPINVLPSDSEIDNSAKILFNYPSLATNVKVTKVADTFNFEPEDAGQGGEYKAKIDGKEYELHSFHFHTPSEHRFEDEYFPLEVHFVHKDAETYSQLAVVGIFFDLVDRGRGSAFLVSLEKGVKTAQKSESHTANISVIDLNPIRKHVSQNTPYSYSGSLTTPPCTEGVSWFVYKKPLEMVVCQFQLWKKAIKFNSRYTQNTPGHVNLLKYSESNYGEATQA